VQLQQIFRIIADPRRHVNAENNHKFLAEGKWVTNKANAGRKKLAAATEKGRGEIIAAPIPT
jgi:hypothetical protein